ncbi:MAG: hypothetical protein ABH816_01500 [Candidatus Levyibacteriota bacterium]
MIEREKFIDGSNPSEKQRPLLNSIITNDKARAILCEQINFIRDRVEKPVRFGEPRESCLLAFLTGDKYGIVYDSVNRTRIGDIAAYNTDKLHELIINVMESYGLDQEQSRSYQPKELDTDRKKWNNGIINCAFGNKKEVLIYPSQKIKGLVFVREKLINQFGETVSIRWMVKDEAPINKVDIKGLFLTSIVESVRRKVRE